MDKNLQSLFNYCTGKSNEEWVEVCVSHSLGNNKRKVPIFPSLGNFLTGIFVGYNQRGDGAVLRISVEDIRIASRSLEAGLRETVEIV